MYLHTINGKAVEGKGEVEKVYDPCTGKVLAEYNTVDKEQCQEALNGAEAAFRIWKNKTIAQREACILSFREELIDKREELIALLMSETGKPKNSASGDFDMLPDCLYYFNEENKRLNGQIIKDANNSHINMIEYVPLGVVVGYLAWNFPILNLGYKLGPILASGCTCILKPSSVTPLTTMKIGEIAQKHFPAGVVNIIAGSASNIAPVMAASPVPKMMTMIGSCSAGKNVIRESANYLRHFSLELGGNAPAVIMKDADMEKASFSICNLKFSNAGQVCVSPNRVFVHKDRLDEFVDYAKTYAEKIVLGSGDDSDTVMMGPLATEGALKKMEIFIADATAQGATVVTGGRSTGKGYFFEPTVLLNVTREMKVYKEEVFGPIMSIIPFDDSDDIIALANDTEYGLAAYVFTADLNQALSISEGVDAGSVSVNEPLYAYNLPHGGLKESGVGKDCSVYSLKEYFYIKRVSIKRV